MARPISNIEAGAIRLRGRGGGFTLTECMVAIAVLSVGVAGVMVPLSASHRQRTDTNQAEVATMLARQLLEEMSALPYSETDGTLASGPPANKTRDNYTSLGCYNGYSDSTSAMTTIDGASIGFGTAVPTYRRSVSITYMNSRTGDPASSGDFAYVAVTVTQPNGRTLVLNKLFTRSTQSW